MAKKAVVLLSGELASAAAPGIALQTGYELHTIPFNYGQHHRHEFKGAGCQDLIGYSPGLRQWL